MHLYGRLVAAMSLCRIIPKGGTHLDSASLAIYFTPRALPLSYHGHGRFRKFVSPGIGPFSRFVQSVFRVRQDQTSPIIPPPTTFHGVASPLDLGWPKSPARSSSKSYQQAVI
ncbi:hypothetical protein D9619_004878 [Psilocybe cf. subviscida]|uniref:Uncharacterized protein n=1 Tax=Psilocybe cf. subviscida TaxID=2480587 RepID=A0A8H5BPK9_9AGAR|nr:hypothetical protein D9619_004878 [Psilocybe cf. subviscida]